MDDKTTYRLINMAEVAIGAGFLIRGLSHLLSGKNVAGLGYQTAPASPLVDRSGRLRLDRGDVIEKAELRTVHGIDERVSYVLKAIRRDSLSPFIKEAALAVVSKKCGDHWCIAEKDDKTEASALFWAVKDPRSPIALRYVRDHQKVDQFTSAEKSIKLGGGDCIPEHTPLLRSDGQLVPVERIKPGDMIWGRDNWTRVVEVWDKGIRETYGVVLSNGKTARLTPDHKIWIDRPALHRIPLSEIKPGQQVIRPIWMPGKGASAGHVMPDGSPPAWWTNLHGDRPRETGIVSVVQILYDRANHHCWDLATEDHYIYLPHSDWVVSNCDDSVILLGSLLQVVGFPVTLRVVHALPDNDYGHIYLLAGVPKHAPTQWIPLDTTMKRAYPGWQVPGADATAKNGKPNGIVVRVRDYPV